MGSSLSVEIEAEVELSGEDLKGIECVVLRREEAVSGEGVATNDGVSVVVGCDIEVVTGGGTGHGCTSTAGGEPNNGCCVGACGELKPTVGAAE